MGLALLPHLLYCEGLGPNQPCLQGMLSAIVTAVNSFAHGLGVFRSPLQIHSPPRARQADTYGLFEWASLRGGFSQRETLTRDGKLRRE